VIGQKLGEAWGQQVVIDNRIGAVGPEIAARALPDGYTLMFTTSALTVREAVFALKDDRFFREAMGATMVDYYTHIKLAEIERFQAEVSDWEQREYFEMF
jgi:glutamine synthetase